MSCTKISLSERCDVITTELSIENCLTHDRNDPLPVVVSKCCEDFLFVRVLSIHNISCRHGPERTKLFDQTACLILDNRIVCFVP